MNGEPEAASDSAPQPVSAAALKLDPETLALRARPMRAIRFRRGLIIGIATLGSVSVMTIAWVALKPRIFERVVHSEELSEPAGKAPSDTLAQLPSSYGSVPQLGPPLPGDLGGPIVAHQREMASEYDAESSGTGDAQRAADAARAEQDRQVAELKAARESGVLVQMGTSQSSGAPVAAANVDPASSEAGEPARIALDRDKDPGAQQRKADFVAARDTGSDINPHGLARPVSPYTLMAGSVIAASLITGLNSDLPGLVTAQVTQNVYDSASGQILLVPQGARLIGSYDSVVAFGQKRALVVWQRIVLPDGSSLRIDNVPATDAAGYAGLADKVDFHTWALLKGIGLATLLGVGTELTISGESDLVQAIRESTQQNVARAGDRITQRNLDIQPTIKIRPGTPVRLVVQKDLILAPWRGRGG